MLAGYSLGFVEPEGRMSRTRLVLLALAALSAHPAAASGQADTTRRRDTTRTPAIQDTVRRVQAESRGEIDLTRSAERFGVGRPNYGFSLEEAVELQQALSRAGCDIGTVDGGVGDRTLSGIQFFRSRQQLDSVDIEAVLTAMSVSFARPAQPVAPPAP